MDGSSEVADFSHDSVPQNALSPQRREPFLLPRLNAALLLNLRSISATQAFFRTLCIRGGFCHILIWLNDDAVRLLNATREAIRMEDELVDLRAMY